MMKFDLDEIVEVTVKIIRSVQLNIKEEISEDPYGAMQPVTIRETGKHLATIDLVVERNTKKKLRNKLKSYSLLLYGEESLLDASLDLSKKRSLVIIMDMVDGTDLLARGLSNWCSAMIYYYPPEHRILASFVGIPDEAVYFAREDSENAYKYLFRKENNILQIKGPSDVKSLDIASIAFYGQKLKRLLSVVNKQKFLSWLKKSSSEARIYNLAGNPMMMRVIDGHTRTDALFELEGQAPHDVVPGAYIAQKAGAIFSDLQGNPIDFNKALIRPADPSSRISYILASTKELSEELQDLFNN